MLSDTLIQEFQTIFKEEYGIEMNTADAEKASAWLVAYFDVLATEEEH
ncbi:MAG TPA: hypothetical protein PKA42_02960 [Candidatus Paceibacterota bacterium]|nr:hypothetical protein [Candidatus Paceibacterota bacterium]HMO83105.1 hypothetical protein [Candidatus Paceibacterota bacterium]